MSQHPVMTIPTNGKDPSASPAAVALAPAVDSEVVARAQRRSFTADYKRQVLDEADRCTQPGQCGALLRRKENKREPSCSTPTKAMEAAKSLGGSRQEPSGVGRAGCCDSRRWNMGGLTWSVAHIHRNEWYKPKR